MIRAQDLSKYYGETPAVQDLSFEVKDGETFVLLGTSGCGKTTTLKMINQLVPPSEGTVYIDDQSIFEVDPVKVRRNIGYVIQDIGLFPHYTVYENVAVVPELLGWDKNKIKDRIHALLEQVGLPKAEFSQNYPHELSGGQQQRVGIARALAADPPIVLMDEPFGALDLITRKKIRHEFVHLEALKDKTVIMVTHDVSEAIELGDRIGLMDAGKMQQVGTAKELLFDPENAFVEDFFGDDRYALGLEVLTLGELVAWMPDRSGDDQPAKAFSTDHLLVDVLRWCSREGTEQTLIGIETGKQTVKVMITDLFDAYHKSLSA